MAKTIKPLRSSMLSKAVYDDETLELTLTFQSGGDYTHRGVPLDIAQGLFAASSPGKYWHAMIKGIY